ncbi:TIGR04255 family protein [Labrys monachus]|uniref:Uncharacterized protein (TIGR04255 family) n=1 Tax=Labrys monachus TaxID=217067 RepID=A0ABU0FDH3_9HYPH|nr:TIGR04255 family protein [Labrys monachus]MDQ0392653.1 uncharacterized protein (TIGR04255 family) [Labrys monachus]
MQLKYKNAPINELIIGAYFDQPILQLHSEHVGLFWAEVRSDFPKIQQQPELSLPISAPNISFQFGLTNEPYPMPRFWLLSEDESMLIQIQKNAFIVNWRKGSGEYPHYGVVKSFFDKYFSIYLEFLKRELAIESVNIQISELTYSNLIEKNEYWKNSFDTSRLISSMSIPHLGVNVEGAPDFNYVTAYRLDTDLTLNLSVRSGRKITDASVPVLVFELRAIGALGTATKVTADGWYIKAHEMIGQCFTAMTNPDIQRDHWQPV